MRILKMLSLASPCLHFWSVAHFVTADNLNGLRTQGQGYLVGLNSADDFINPPELNIMPDAIKKLPRAKFVLLPITEKTRGHGTHTLSAIWQGYLAELLNESAMVRTNELTLGLQ